MMNKQVKAIRQWLAPPFFDGDEQKTIQASLLNFSILAGVLVVMLILIGNIIDWKHTPTRNYLIDIGVLALAFYWRHLIFKGQVRASAAWQVLTGFVVMALSSASEGTILSAPLVLLPILIMLAGFMFDSSGIILTTVTSSLLAGGLIISYQAGMLPPAAYTQGFFLWFVVTIFFILGGAMVLAFIRLKDNLVRKAHLEVEIRERVEDELRVLTRAVEQSPASVVITNLAGDIQYVNSRFTQVTGYSLEDVVGHNPRVLKTDRTPAGTHDALWSALVAGREWQGEFVNQRKDGSHYYEFAAISPIKDRDGNITQYLAVKEDITDRKRQEAELRESEARYRSLFEQTTDAVIVFGLDFKILTANQRTLDLLGYSLDELTGMSMVEISAEPDKTRQVEEKLLAGLEVPLYERKLFHKDGHWISAEVSIGLARAEDGTPLHVQSVVRDISERKSTEEALRSSETKYRIVVENNYDWEFWSNPAGGFEYISPSCKNITGYSPEELIADPDLVRRMVVAEDEAVVADHLEKTMLLTRHQIHYRIHHKQGGIRWIGHTCAPIFNEQGVFLGLRGSNQDITERKLAEEELARSNRALEEQLSLVNLLKDQLQEQAIRDPLTGLFNRRYLSDVLPRELIRAEREKSSVSVLIMDLDLFKEVNDTYGHSAGDEFLRDISGLIGNNLRGSDIACRYGGEEFLVVMPGANVESGLRRAEEIRKKCAGLNVNFTEHTIKVTISAGIATYPDHGTNFDEVLSHADKALYYSKGTGRNRVTAWQVNLPARM
jgi:diguanylate cyclase (GGDEF)-like protein/PAS domain S-box-containing protein